MKLPKRPKGLFHAGHSGARFSASDMPMLRSLREAYARMLPHAKAMQAEETDPGGLLAAATVVGQLQDFYDATGEVLALLERTPHGWRP